MFRNLKLIFGNITIILPISLVIWLQNIVSISKYCQLGEQGPVTVLQLEGNRIMAREYFARVTMAGTGRGGFVNGASLADHKIISLFLISFLLTK